MFGVVLNGDDSEWFDVINFYNVDNGIVKGFVFNGLNMLLYVNMCYNMFYLVGIGGG